MNGAAPNLSEIPPRGKVKKPFCLFGNQDFDVFLPIMGADSFAIYTYLVRRLYHNPRLKHSVRDLASATGIGITTVSRSLEVLEHLRLVKVSRFGGSKGSECKLLDSEVLANHLGAIYNPGTLSYSLPPQVIQELKAELRALRRRQQGKHHQNVRFGGPRTPKSPSPRVSQGDTSVSPERFQRFTRETQMGSHLIQEEKRNKEVPSPTPSQECESQKAKDSPDEDEPARLLRWAEVRFTGLMNDIGDHLFDTSRPPVSHLPNGAAEWREFGFDSLAVECAEQRGEGLVLVLSASDPAAARRGLDKYRKKWEASLRKWYECDVQTELQQTQPKR